LPESSFHNDNKNPSEGKFASVSVRATAELLKSASFSEATYFISSKGFEGNRERQNKRIKFSARLLAKNAIRLRYMIEFINEDEMKRNCSIYYVL